MPASRLILAAALVVAAAAPCRAGFNYRDEERQARWQDLQAQIFGRSVSTVDDGTVRLEAPEVALDAATVPLAVALAHPQAVRALTIVIDDNPSPLAARFTFGPEADPGLIRLRVRVNHLTMIHAVAETREGALVAAARLVKASGGCSAPMGMSDEEAMRGMGEIKLRPTGSSGVALMIRHPNFNGMQMNEALQVYTPARYIQAIDVGLRGRRVFRLDTDISLASNPVISFSVQPGDGDLTVDVADSKGATWSKAFALPVAGE